MDIPPKQECSGNATFSEFQAHPSQDLTLTRHIKRPIIPKSILLDEKYKRKNILMARKRNPKMCRQLKSERFPECARDTRLYSAINKFKSFSVYDLKVSHQPQEIKDEDERHPTLSDVLKKTESLRAKRSLSSLQITLKYDRPSHQKFRDFSLKLEKFKLLSTLHLRFENMPIDDLNLRDLSQRLRGLRQLTDLILDFRYYHKITDKGLEHLSKGLYNLQKLCSLCINVSLTGPEPSNMDVNTFIIHRNRWTKFKLELQGYKGIKDKGLEHISMGLRNLKVLSHLSLNFSSCEITNKGTEVLFKTIKEIGSLAYLNLNLSDCPGITDLSFLFEGVRGSSLNQLALDVSSWKKTTDIGLEDLFRHYDGTSLPHTLKVLSLNVSSRESEQGMLMLLMGIPHLISLTTLNLQLSSKGITEKTVTSLFEALRELKFLSNLSLSLGNYQRNDTNCFEALALGLQQLGSLYSLKLKLGEIVGKNAQILSVGLIKLKSLAIFDFILEDSYFSDVKACQALLLAVQEMKLLSELRITLSKPKQFNDVEVQILTGVLGQLKFLSRLYVHVDCGIISEGEIILLLKTIKKNKNLSNVNLNFIPPRHDAPPWTKANEKKMKELRKELNWPQNFHIISPYVKLG